MLSTSDIVVLTAGTRGVIDARATVPRGSSAEASGTIAGVIWVWVVGAALLVAAGFAVAYVPRTRARALRQRTAWSAARAAIASAAVSRDAADDVPEAEDLFARAELLAAHRGGVAAAEEAADCAERADRLWREAAR